MSRSGPNTVPGKARVSKNAVTHGIMSPSPVLTRLEEETEWERHRGGEIEDSTMEDIEKWTSHSTKTSKLRNSFRLLIPTHPRK